MTSPYELKLQARIGTEVDPLIRARLTAQLGCYLARAGEFDRAEKIRTELRSSFGDGRSANISIHVMLMEGLINLYRSAAVEARDRIARAQLLSTSFRENSLVALTSAWLAHIDFNRSDFKLMRREIDTCISNLSFDDGSALCRISLVLGDAYLFCGEHEVSQAWYERARQSATALGDQAAIGAITYNRAAICAQNFRLSQMRGVPFSRPLAQIEAEVATAINYQALAQLQSLDYLLLASRAGVLMSQRQYEMAEAEIVKLLDIGIVPPNCSEHLVLLADLAFLRARNGNLQEAKKLRVEVFKNIDSDIDYDDRAIIYFALSESAVFCEDSVVAQEELNAATVECQKHDALVADLKSVLETYKNPDRLLAV